MKEEERDESQKDQGFLHGQIFILHSALYDRASELKWKTSLAQSVGQPAGQLGLSILILNWQTKERRRRRKEEEKSKYLFVALNEWTDGGLGSQSKYR